jgi:AraC-like DNA-binding protein
MLTLYPILIVINIVAGLHGMVLAAFISFNRRSNRLAGRYLALIVLIISLNTLGSAYYFTSIFHRFPALTIFLQPLPLFIGPIFWSYILALTDPAGFCSSPPRRLHFLPGTLNFLVLCVIFLVPSWQSLFVKNLMCRDSWMGPFFSLTYLIHIAIYLVLSWLALLRHSRRIRNSFSNIERINLSWLRYLLISFLCFFALIVLLHVIPLPINIFGEVPVSFIYFFFIAIFIFVLGYRGLRQPGLFSVENGEPAAEKAKKYEKTGLDEGGSEILRERLLALIAEKKPHLDPELTLAQLAQSLQASPHHLSQLLNEGFRQNFYQFINGYRLNEAQSRLCQPGTNPDKLLKIAFDCGFNSLSTFNRVFKELTGLTPSQFREKPGVQKKD